MITVFTPTYNRVKDLERLYNSLTDQYNTDFVWMIVDDGSTDNTSNFVHSIINNDKFKIIYHRQNNAGKHIAINWALDNCTTKYMICVDSDDYLAKDATQVLNSSTLEDDFDKCWALVGPRFSINKNYSNWSESIPNIILFSEIYTKYKYIGETFMLWNLRWFNNIRFPMFPGENFIPECGLYDVLDQNSNVKTLVHKLYFSDYQNDGLTKNSKSSFANNRSGYAYANYISATNKNRSVFQRSIYWGRSIAILKREKIFLSEINPKMISTPVRLFAKFTSIVFFIKYSINKQ